MTMPTVRATEPMGCFVAAVGSLIGKPFQAAKTALGFRPGQYVGEDPSSALARLRLVGITPRRRAFRRQDRRMLLLIRWREDPSLMHAVVWTGKRVIESARSLSALPLTEYESQLEAAYEV